MQFHALELTGERTSDEVVDGVFHNFCVGKSGDIMNYFAGEYDVAVVGAGHAGIEAALAAARLNCKTAIFTINMDAVGNCPAIRQSEEQQKDISSVRLTHRR